MNGFGRGLGQRFACGAAILLQLAAGRALAADEGLAEVVVTAQKRAQNLQEVPIAVSAVDSAWLEQRNITSIEQLGSLAPNVSIERGGAFSTVALIAIRGTTTLNPSLTWEPAVGLYFDGVYMGKSQAAFFDIADIERVEILRGPQGTLYGRNTLAGAINIISEKPSGEFGVTAQASYGNYDYRQLKSSVDLPAFGPVSIKFSGQISRRDGFVDLVPNPVAGVPTAGVSPDEAIQDLDSRSGMVQLRFAPSDALTVDYSFDYSDIDQTPAFTQAWRYYPGGIFDPSSPAYAFGGAFFPFDRYVSRERLEEASYDTDVFEHSQVWGHSLTAAFVLGTLGELKSITAYRDVQLYNHLDLDGTPLQLADSSLFSDYRFFSQELQLTGERDRLNYVLGVYYSDDSGKTEPPDENSPQIFFGGASAFDPRYGFDTRTYAAYGQADYELTERLTLTGGLRYTREEKGITRLMRSLVPAPVTVIEVGEGEVPDAEYSNVTPTVVLSYEPVEEVRLYAKYARGFKSGGFNGETSSLEELLNPYDAETVDSYELGLKSRLLGNSLQLNVAAFWDEHEDMQLSVFTGRNALESFVLNAGQARIRGLEVEALAQPHEDLLVQASLAYLDPEYEEFIDAGENVADNRAFSHAPEYQASASLDWTAWRGGRGKLNVIGDLRFIDEHYIYPYPLRGVDLAGHNAGNTRVPSRTVVDARLVLSELAVGEGEWQVSLWGRNLFDEKKPFTFIDFGSSFGGLTTANFIDPRTYGLSVGVRF